MQCDFCKGEVTGLSNAYLCYSTARLLHNQLRGMNILIAFTKAKYLCLRLSACRTSGVRMCKRQEYLCGKGHVMRGRHHVMRAEVL
jgi:hypothetical protein